MDPVTAGLVIGGVTLAAKAQGKALGGLAGALSPAGKAYRKQLKKDIKRMEGGELGMTKEQRDEAMRQAVKGIQAQSKGREAALMRQQGAAGLGRSGVQGQEALALTAGKQAAVGGAAAQIAGEHKRLSAAEKAEILARTDAQRRKVRDDWNLLGEASGEATEAGLATYSAEKQKKAQAGITAGASAGPTPAA